MKKTILTLFTGATLISAQAQLFSPESVSGAFLGSLIGGIAGGDNRNGFSGNGAAIGAGVGLLAGALVGEARRQDYYYSQPYDYTPAPSVSFGYGYGSCNSSAYVYYAPNSYCAPNYYYRPTRPNYAIGGTLLGAASGALIGAGDHNAGEGAAIGAAAGLVLGGIAESAARHREQKAAPATYVTSAPPPQPQAQVNPSQPEAARQVEDQTQYQITSQPVATSTYYWTPRPQQIPDAPLVPDAPKF